MNSDSFFEYFSERDEERLGKRKQRVLRTAVPGCCWRFAAREKVIYFDWSLRLSIVFGILAPLSGFASFLLLQASVPRVTESVVFGFGSLLMLWAFLRSVLNRNLLIVTPVHFTIKNVHHFRTTVCRFSGAPVVSIQKLVVWTDYAQKLTKYEGFAAFVKRGDSFFVFCMYDSEEKVRERMRRKFGIVVDEKAVGGSARTFYGVR